MGIPYYYSYLIKKYNKKILIKFFNDKLNYSFLDSNSIIYDVCRSETDENKIIINVCNKLNDYLIIFNCSILNYITFDGLPPFAKIQQQRSRRYKSYITKKLLNSNIVWDTCSITTGTKFMNILTEEIFKYKFKKNVKISSSNEPGEGEHKIFHYIRNNTKILKDEDILIYGLDADLIMLSLYHLKYVNNIYLYRETPEFIKNFKIDINENDNYVINIKELKNIIEEKCNIDDYILLCFLLGNDFLPHFPTLNIRKDGIQKILDIYKKVNLRLIDEDDNICWNNFRKIINELYNEEYASFKILYSNIYSKSVNLYENNEEILNNLPSIDKSLELEINPYNTNIWVYNYYKQLFDKDINYEKDFIKKTCINYIEGIEWCYKYYTGKPIDYNWYYKYHYPPLFCDLINYIPFYNYDFINYNFNKFNEIMQLCYVLPYGSLNLIPENIKIKLNLNWYKSDCKIRWAYCKYFWEGHVDLPYIDIDELKVICS